MPRFRVQYDDGPALEISVELPKLPEGAAALTPEQEAAKLRELAWDAYKQQTKEPKARPRGIRRRIVSEAKGEIQPPAIVNLDDTAPEPTP